MTRKGALYNALPQIEDFLDNYDDWSFTKWTLYNLFDTKRSDWKMPHSKTGKHFIDFLQLQDLLSITAFTDQEGKRKPIYTWKTQDEFTKYAALQKGGYFTHYSAMFLNQLTLQIPKTHYLNHEHSSITPKQKLEQGAINRAFSQPQRKSSKQYSFRGKTVVILNGMFTNRLGVEHVKTNEQRYYFTNLERTLIDIAIRPVYSGGIFEVLEAYRKAKDVVDISKLKLYLDKMDYTYPYHQIIGFYLEHSGFTEVDLSKFEHDINLDFFLTYNIQKKAYSKRWRIYYPEGIIV